MKFHNALIYDALTPARWRPLIMSFQKFYGLAPGRLHASALGQIPEAMYRSPDVDRARAAVCCVGEPA